MKKLWMWCLPLLLWGSCSEKSDKIPMSGGNEVVAFSLILNDQSYEAVIGQDQIQITIPYNRSLKGAKAEFQLNDYASIRPDPAAISDWDQDWRFLISSSDRTDRTYFYTVVRENIATEGDLTLRTQAEVDAFEATGINAVEGDLTIGVEGGNPIKNLDGLINLTTVCNRLTITNAYRGENLAGLANLNTCGELLVGDADSPHKYLQQIILPALQQIDSDARIFAGALGNIEYKVLAHIGGSLTVASDALSQLIADELVWVGGEMRLSGTTTDAAKAPCEQMYFPKLESVGGTLTVSRFDRVGQLATTFNALITAGGLHYEHLALVRSFEFPLITATGHITLNNCATLRSVSLPQITSAGALTIRGCPAAAAFEMPKLAHITGDVLLTTLPAVNNLQQIFPALSAIDGDLTLDDMSSLAGKLDLSDYAFTKNSTLSLRFISAPKLTEISGGNFAGSILLDATTLTPQPAAMPFAITEFGDLDSFRMVGFTGIDALSLPITSCENLSIESCGSRAPFTLTLPALTRVRGTLLCRNCGKGGAENSASFPLLKHIGRQLSMYVNASSFSSLSFPELETVGDGQPVSEDPSSDYAFYTMPTGCTEGFVLPKLTTVNGNMLVSTWNSTTDKVPSLGFPALKTVTGELFLGHDRYANRSVTALDFSKLESAGKVSIGNLSSVIDFGTFANVIPALSDQTWRVEGCGYNPTYQQMLNGETVRP